MLFEKKDFLILRGQTVDFSYAWLSWGKLYKRNEEEQRHSVIANNGWYFQIKFPIPFICRIPDLAYFCTYEEACLPVWQVVKWDGQMFYRKMVRVLTDEMHNIRRNK